MSELQSLKDNDLGHKSAGEVAWHHTGFDIICLDE